MVQEALDAEGAKPVDARVLLPHSLGAPSHPLPSPVHLGEQLGCRWTLRHQWPVREAAPPRRSLPPCPDLLGSQGCRGPMQHCKVAGAHGAALRGTAQTQTGPAPPIRCPGADTIPAPPALQGCWAGVLPGCWSCMFLGALSLLPRPVSRGLGWLWAPGHDGAGRKATANCPLALSQCKACFHTLRVWWSHLSGSLEGLLPRDPLHRRRSLIRTERSHLLELHPV